MPSELIFHVYLLIATKERSLHDSFMLDKYFSRQNSHSLFIGFKDPEMTALSLFPTIYEWKKRATGDCRYCLNLSNSHKSLIRSQCCNQHSQQQGSCRINPPPPVWLPLAPHRLRQTTEGVTVQGQRRQLGLAVTSQGRPGLA